MYFSKKKYNDNDFNKQNYFKMLISQLVFH